MLEQTAVVTPGQKHKLENVRSGEYPVEFPLRLMYKDLLNVERLAGQACRPDSCYRCCAADVRRRAGEGS